MSTPRKPDAACSIDGCDNLIRATHGSPTRGLCGKHNQRVLRYGNPHHVTSEEDWRLLCRRAQINLGRLKPTTYQKYLGKHLHRRVAEQKLGRALLPGEIVHHVDGDRHNNDPSNIDVLANQSEHIKKHRRGNKGRLVSAC